MPSEMVKRIMQTHRDYDKIKKINNCEVYVSEDLYELLYQIAREKKYRDGENYRYIGVTGIALELLDKARKSAKINEIIISESVPQDKPAPGKRQLRPFQTYKPMSEPTSKNEIEKRKMRAELHKFYTSIAINSDLPRAEVLRRVLRHTAKEEAELLGIK